MRSGTAPRQGTAGRCPGFARPGCGNCRCTPAPHPSSNPVPRPRPAHTAPQRDCGSGRAARTRWKRSARRDAAPPGGACARRPIHRPASESPDPPAGNPAPHWARPAKSADCCRYWSAWPSAKANHMPRSRRSAAPPAGLRHPPARWSVFHRHPKRRAGRAAVAGRGCGGCPPPSARRQRCRRQIPAQKRARGCPRCRGRATPAAADWDDSPDRCGGWRWQALCRCGDRSTDAAAALGHPPA